MHKPSRVGVAGPHAAGFRGELAGRHGYLRSRATGFLLLMAQLSRWLTSHGVDPRDLSDGICLAATSTTRPSTQTSPSPSSQNSTTSTPRPLPVIPYPLPVTRCSLPTVPGRGGRRFGSRRRRGLAG